MSCSGGSHSVSNWVYVAIAYLVVWSAIAAYAVILARRVTQTQDVVDALQGVPGADTSAGDRDSR